MSRDDIARVAIGAPALQELLIISLPDCLLVKAWARADVRDPEESAVLLGNAYRVATDALGAAPSVLTLEGNDHTLLLSHVTSEMIAAFTFDRTAPLGLVRVQARQLADHIRGSINLADTPVDEPEPRESTPPEAPKRPLAPAFVDGGPTTLPRANELPPSGGEMPLAAATSSSTRPRAVRLLEFFQRYAPDPHASLLRLSLRTGIPVDALESPEVLSDTQVEAVAATVRDILGQDQVGL